MDSDAQGRQALQMRCNALQQQLTEGNERENTLRATIQVLVDVEAVRADASHAATCVAGATRGA